MQMALQSQLKLFWRPAALKKKPGTEVEHQLKISQQGNALLVNNPTAYYITLAFLAKTSKASCLALAVKCFLLFLLQS